MSQNVSHQEAAEALDSLDDYARMGTGVDAYGPRGMLERYIAQQAATLRQQAARVDEGMVERAQIIYALERAQRRLEDQAYRAEGYDASFPAEDAARMKEAITLLQVALVDDCYSRDLRHLVYLDTQFNMRGETDLKLPELRSLEDRGWIAEGDYNGEYVLTEAGERFVEAALSAQPAPERQGEAETRSMESAPRDGTMLRLMVRFTEHATDDAEEAWTIGSNSFDANGEDVWQFAGWCWTHDHFTEGKGTPIGWLPFHDTHPAAPVGVPDGLYLNACEAVESWKARALKAEEVSDRLMEEINNMTGPMFMGEPVLAKPVPDVNAMVDRFLGWRLPADFAPDNGISYTPIPRHPGWTHDTHPVGTNLFTSAQAKAMFEYVLAAAPSAPQGTQQGVG